MKFDPYYKNIFTKRFYKENGLWYIDLPEFIEGGFGTKSNLLMVDGSDLMLDVLSNNTTEVVVQFSDYETENPTAIMQKAESGFDQQVLDKVGHAPIEYGRYYNSTATVNNNVHSLKTWLCPVAEWVFGYYPDTIWVKIIN